MLNNSPWNSCWLYLTWDSAVIAWWQCTLHDHCTIYTARNISLYEKIVIRKNIRYWIIYTFLQFRHSWMAFIKIPFTKGFEMLKKFQLKFKAGRISSNISKRWSVHLKNLFASDPDRFNKHAFGDLIVHSAWWHGQTSLSVPPNNTKNFEIPTRQINIFDGLLKIAVRA